MLSLLVLTLCLSTVVKPYCPTYLNTTYNKRPTDVQPSEIARFVTGEPETTTTPSGMLAAAKRCHVKARFTCSMPRTYLFDYASMQKICGRIGHELRGS